MAMYNLALAHERLGLYETALTWMRKARQKSKDDSSLHSLEVRLKFLSLRKRIVTFVRVRLAGWGFKAVPTFRLKIWVEFQNLFLAITSCCTPG